MNKIKTVISFLCCTVILISCASPGGDKPGSQNNPTNLPLEKSETHDAPESLNSTLVASTATPGKIDTPVNDGVELILDNFEKNYAFFKQVMKTTNWIRQVSTSKTFNEQTKTYSDHGVFEEWYRFDADGNYVEGYNWVSSTGGTIEQESCYQNGRIYNVTFKTFNKGVVASSIDFTGGFAGAFKNGNNKTQDRIKYQGRDSWKFSFEMKDGILTFVRTIYFDQVTGLILGKETWLKESGGSTRLISSTIIRNFEVNADPPLEHFQKISSQVPK